MEITVALLKTFEWITLDVGNSDTVKSVKEKIEKTQGIPVDHQWYMFNQKPLTDDDALLADIGVKESSIIYECTVVRDT